MRMLRSLSMAKTNDDKSPEEREEIEKRSKSLEDWKKKQFEKGKLPKEKDNG